MSDFTLSEEENIWDLISPYVLEIGSILEKNCKSGVIVTITRDTLTLEGVDIFKPLHRDAYASLGRILRQTEE